MLRAMAVLYILIVNVLLLYLVYSRRGQFPQENIAQSSIAQFLLRARQSAVLAPGTAQTKAPTATSIASIQLPHATDSTHQPTSECSISASMVFAVLPTVPSASTAGFGKFAPPYDHYVRLLQQILKLSRNLQPNDIYVRIFLDVETLHPAHRLWCRDIPWCHLHLMSNASDSVAVVQTMYDLRLCAPRYVVLPDTANIDSAFMLRLHMLPVARVACLTSQATNSLTDVCPSRAFQIPTTFHITARTNTPDSPRVNAVITAAVQQGLYAGAFNIVNMQ